MTCWSCCRFFVLLLRSGPTDLNSVASEKANTEIAYGHTILCRFNLTIAVNFDCRPLGTLLSTLKDSVETGLTRSAGTSSCRVRNLLSRLTVVFGFVSNNRVILTLLLRPRQKLTEWCSLLDSLFSICSTVAALGPALLFIRKVFIALTDRTGIATFPSSLAPCEGGRPTVWSRVSRTRKALAGMAWEKRGILLIITETLASLNLTLIIVVVLRGANRCSRL